MAAENTNGLSAGMEAMAERLKADSMIIVRDIAQKVAEPYLWAYANRPRLLHLAINAKKARTAKKNITRIIREYSREG